MATGSGKAGAGFLLGFVEEGVEAGDLVAPRGEEQAPVRDGDLLGEGEILSTFVREFDGVDHAADRCVETFAKKVEAVFAGGGDLSRERCFTLGVRVAFEGDADSGKRILREEVVYGAGDDQVGLGELAFVGVDGAVRRLGAGDRQDGYYGYVQNTFHAVSVQR